MTRRLYCASLLWLQLLLISDVVPPWGRFLAASTVTAALQDGWLAVLPMAGAGIALLASTLVLAAPSLALLRHRQRGPRRFDGVPRWAAALAIVGALVHVAASTPWWLARLLPVEARVETLLACEPCLAAGLALMIGGGIGAELLRRGARPARPHSDADGTAPDPGVRRLRSPLPIRIA